MSGALPAVVTVLTPVRFLLAVKSAVSEQRAAIYRGIRTLSTPVRLLTWPQTHTIYTQSVTVKLCVLPMCVFSGVCVCATCVCILRCVCVCVLRCVCVYLYHLCVFSGGRVCVCVCSQACVCYLRVGSQVCVCYLCVFSGVAAVRLSVCCCRNSEDR